MIGKLAKLDISVLHYNFKSTKHAPIWKVLFYSLSSSGERKYYCQRQASTARISLILFQRVSEQIDYDYGNRAINTGKLILEFSPI